MTTRRRADRSPATTSCWRLAAGRTSSARPGSEHAWPLYSLDDAERLRSRVLAIFEDADRDPSLVDKGALNFVIVGAGATGTEVAGALAEMIRDVMPSEYRDLAVQRAPRSSWSTSATRSSPRSPTKAHDYATQGAPSRRRRDPSRHVGHGDRARSRRAVRRIDHPDALRRSGQGACRRRSWPAARARPGPRRTDRRRAATCALPGFPKRLRDRRLREHRGARTASPSRSSGSVALQAGQWAANNIRADIEGKPRKAFHYHDKGIMAMIGKGAAVAEVGEHRHELHGADRVLGMARRARRPAQRRARPRRCVRQLGVGLLHQDARAAGARSIGRRSHRLGRRRSHQIWRYRCLRSYDVIIIGTGAGGGTLAHTLAPSGSEHPAAGARRLPAARDGQLDARRPSSRTASTCRRTPGTTPTGKPSSRRCTTTSGARPRCTAPRCTACVHRTSVSSSTSTACHRRGRMTYDDFEPYYTKAE